MSRTRHLPTGSVLRAVLALLTSGCALTLEVDEVVPSRPDASTQQEPNPENLAFSDFWKRLAPLQCSYAQQCLGDAFVEFEFFSMSECMARVQAGYDDTLNSMTVDIDAGWIIYDADKAQKCLDDLASLQCAKFSVSILNCQTSALIPTGKPGDACVRDQACNNGYCDSPLQCPGTCRRIGAAGSACTHNATCESNVCLDERCMALAQAGEPCEGNSGSVCVFTTYCRGASQNVPGRCISALDVFSRGANERCEFEDAALDLCGDGLRCAMFSATDKRCTPKVGSGMACRSSFISMCPTGEYCDVGDGLEGVCRPAPYQVGKPCVSGLGQRPCGPGSYCDADGICQDERRVWESCSSDADCYTTGLCVADQCSDSVCTESGGS